MSETIMEEKKIVPTKVKVGRILLVIGSILMMVDGLFSLVWWAIRLAAIWSPMENITPLPFTTFIDSLNSGVQPLLCLFLFFAGIAGINYVRDKGPFIWMCSWMAIILIIVMIYDWVVAIRDAVVGGSFGLFLLGILSFGLFEFLYVIGWFLTKDYLE